MWFWIGTNLIWGWFYDWICCNKMVSGTRTLVKFIWLYCIYRCMVSGVHFHGADGPETIVSRSRSCASVTPPHRGISPFIWFLISIHKVNLIIRRFFCNLFIQYLMLVCSWLGPHQSQSYAFWTKMQKDTSDSSPHITDNHLLKSFLRSTLLLLISWRKCWHSILGKGLQVRIRIHSHPL